MFLGFSTYLSKATLSDDFQKVKVSDVGCFALSVAEIHSVLIFGATPIGHARILGLVYSFMVVDRQG